ncbi:MAG: NUDIX hydrolase [Actinomycetota bacterium]|nr:NUDIX hydrolase [Actinomycetota bacterium]
MDREVLRRKVGTAALMGFRMLPGPLKRAMVRVGTPNYTVGAVCVLEHEDEDEVLLLWQPHRRGWSLPGGLLNRGEEPADAVIREVREEIGLEIEPGDPITVGVHPHSQSVDVVFRVRIIGPRPEITLSHEARKATWWQQADLPETDQETRQILGLIQRMDRPPRAGRLQD